MRYRIIASVVALSGVASFALAAPAQAQSPESAKPAIASVPPPPGWKTCPRCQNEQDKQKANAEYKVEGRKFNPRDLSGVWGSQGVGTTFRNPPPFTPWGQQRFDATIGEKNAAGEIRGQIRKGGNALPAPTTTTTTQTTTTTYTTDPYP